MKHKHPLEVGEPLSYGNASHRWDVDRVEPYRFCQGKTVKFARRGGHDLKRIDMDMVGMPGSAGVGKGPFDHRIEWDGLVDSMGIEPFTVNGEVRSLSVADHRPVHVADTVDEISSFGDFRGINGGKLSRCW